MAVLHGHLMLFPDLADTTAADEQAAIDAGEIQATRIDWVGTARWVVAACSPRIRRRRLLPMPADAHADDVPVAPLPRPVLLYSGT